jgi:hypothetical protein
MKITGDDIRCMSMNQRCIAADVVNAAAEIVKAWDVFGTPCANASANGIELREAVEDLKASIEAFGGKG